VWDVSDGAIVRSVGCCAARVDIDEFVDVIIGAQKIDVSLVVGGGLIAVDRTTWSSSGCFGRLGEIVMTPFVGVEELVDMVVGADVVTVVPACQFTRNILECSNSFDSRGSLLPKPHGWGFRRGSG
jgi:hypothetical protein